MTKLINKFLFTAALSCVFWCVGSVALSTAAVDVLTHRTTISVTNRGVYRYRDLTLPYAIVTNHTPLIINYHIRASNLKLLQKSWPGLRFPDLGDLSGVSTSGSGKNSDLHNAALLVPSKSEIASLFRPGLTLYLRYMMTSKLFSLFTSTDGIHYHLVKSIARNLFPQGQLLSVREPAAWIAPNTHVASGNKPVKKSLTLTISAVRVHTGLPRLPESLLQEFRQHRTLHDTLDEQFRKSFPSTIRILGPFAKNQSTAGIPLHPGFNKIFALANGSGRWVPIAVSGANGSRVVQVNTLLKSNGINQVYFAACTVMVPEARSEELFFDGVAHMTLYVNGEKVAWLRQDRNAVTPDAHQALVKMRAGKNHIIVRLVSGNGNHGRAAFILRAVRGDWHYQLAMRKRLIIAFPENRRSATKLLWQISQLWQRAGYLAQAADTLNEIVHNPAAAQRRKDQGLRRQASLDQQLGQRNQAMVIVKALLRHTTAQGTGAIAQLQASHVWGIIGDHARELAVLQAISENKNMPRFVRYSCGLELAENDWHSGQQIKVPAELRTLAASFTHTDFIYKTLMVEAFIRDAQVHQWTPAMFHTQLMKLGSLQTMSGYELKRLAGITSDLHDQADNLALLHQLALRPHDGSYINWPVTYALALANANQYKAAVTELQGLFQWDQTPVPTSSTPIRQTVNAWRLADLSRSLDASPYKMAIMLAGEVLKPVSLHRLLVFSPQRNMAAIVDGLIMLEKNLLSTGQGRAADAVVRLILQYFPDHPGRLNYQLVFAYVNYGMNQYQHPNEVIAINQSGLNLNLTAPVGSRSYGLNRYITYNAVWAARNSQRFGYSVRVLKRGLSWTVNSATNQADVLLSLGNLYRRQGRIHAAVLCLYLARSVPGIGAHQKHIIDLNLEHTMSLLSITRPAIALDFRVDRALRDAHQALTNGSSREAMRIYQKLLAGHGEVPIAVAAERWIPLQTLIPQRIVSLGPTFLHAWIHRYAGRAMRALHRAERENSVQAIVQIARKYPLTPAASDAMVQVAVINLRRNQPELALGAIESLLQPMPGSGADGPSLKILQLGLRAALCADDQHAYLRLANAMARISGVKPPPAFKTAFIAAGLQNLHMSPSVTAANSPGFAVTFRFPLSDREALRANSPRYPAHIVCHPLLDHQVVYMSTISRVFAFNARTGAIIWQASSGTPRSANIGLNLTAPIFSPTLPKPGPHSDIPAVLPESWVAQESGRIYVRQRDGDHEVLQCRNATNGQLLWSTRDIGTLKSLNAISSPAAKNHHIYALFAGHERRIAVALSARTGRLIWTIPVIPPTGRGRQVRAGQNEPPPTCYGWHLYFGTDQGTVEDINVATGMWQWISGYSRTFTRTTSDIVRPLTLLRRSGGRIFTTEHRIFIAPRDALKVICLSRRNGKILWQHGTNSARLLAATTSLNHHRVLLLQGLSLQLLGADDGDSIWRWKPGGVVSVKQDVNGQLMSRPVRDYGPTLGSAAIRALQVDVTTRLGLYTVNLKSGNTADFSPWNQLIYQPGGGQTFQSNQNRRDLYFSGCTPANILQTEGSVLAAGNGMLIRLNTTPPLSPPQLQPSDKTAAEAITLSPLKLTNGKPGDAMVALWRIGSGTVEQLLKPRSFSNKSWLVVFPRFLASFNPVNGHVFWQRQSLPSSTCLRHGKFVAVCSPSSIYLRSEHSGRLLWSRNRTNNSFVLLTSQYTILVRQNRGTFRVFDNNTGRIVTHWSVQINQWRNIPGAIVYHHHLYAVVRNGQKVNIREYDPSTGSLVRTIDIGFKAHDISVYGMHLVHFKDKWIIAGGHQTIVFNLATRQAINWSPSIANHLWIDDGKLIRFYKRRYWNTRWHTAVMDPMNDRVIIDQITSGSGAADFHQFQGYVGRLIGNVLVHRLGDQSNAIVGTDITTGRQLWRVVVPNPRGGGCRQVYRIPGHMVYCFSSQTQRYRYVIINSHGKITTTGFFPGWPGRLHPAPPAVVGNDILLSTTAGLYCLAPIAPDTLAIAAKQVIGPAVQTLRLNQWLADGEKAIPIYPPIQPTSVVTASPHGAVSVPTPPVKPVSVVKTTLSRANWTARFSAPRHTMNINSSSAESPMMGRTAAVRISYTPIGLRLKLRIRGGLLAESRDSTGPQQGNSILIGINGYDGAADKHHALLLAFWLANGRPCMYILKNILVRTPLPHPGPIAYHLHATMDGMLLHVTVPWTQLINQPNRPRRFIHARVNVALLTQTAQQNVALEWGHGLVNCFDPHLWPLLRYSERK